MSPSQSSTPSPQTMEFLIAVRSMWEQEYECFRKLLPDSLLTHRGLYAVVHEGQGIENGTDPVEVTFRAVSRLGNIDVHVGHVTDEPEPLYRSGVRRVVPTRGTP